MAKTKQEDDMPRGLRAPISPNEQRVLVSLSKRVLPENVRASDIEHLKKLELIEARDGGLDVTSLGHERLSAPKR